MFYSDNANKSNQVYILLDKWYISFNSRYVRYHPSSSLFIVLLFLITEESFFSSWWFSSLTAAVLYKRLYYKQIRPAANACETFWTKISKAIVLQRQVVNAEFRKKSHGMKIYLPVNLRVVQYRDLKQQWPRHCDTKDSEVLLPSQCFIW